MDEQITDSELVKKITGGKFAKLFELEKSQVLLQWDFDAEDDSYLLQFDFRIDGVRAALKLYGFKNIEDVLKAFNKIDKARVSEFYDSVKKQSNGNPLNIIMQQL